MGSQNHSGEKQKQRKEIPLETLIRINRSLVEKEQTQIKSYIQDHNLDMTQTGTGLWYHIEQMKEGPFVKKGQVVELNYKVSLLDGTECYNSDSLGVKSFLVGQGGVENGLEEGILLLKKGSRASFIMAPHLAHGLMGDDDKIPARAILFYEVEVLNVKGQ
jgi:FKBP-type peptidyl-prolyl cis-trans isomerase